jgi:protein-S-isoprenylcysteine O-methyltransferase Ste14
MIGTCLILVGLLLRVVAMRSLGNRFTLVIQKQDDIKTDGIYRLMRHPSYLGSLLIILGASILHPVAGIMVMSWFFFMSRIVCEEALLHSLKYREYKKRTGMFFPKLRSK